MTEIHLVQSKLVRTPMHAQTCKYAHTFITFIIDIITYMQFKLVFKYDCVQYYGRLADIAISLSFIYYNGCIQSTIAYRIIHVYTDKYFSFVQLYFMEHKQVFTTQH